MEKTNIEYLRLALGIAGLPVNIMTADLINEIYEAVKVKKGKFSVSDAIDIQRKVERRYRPRPKVTAKRNAK